MPKDELKPELPDPIRGEAEREAESLDYLKELDHREEICSLKETVATLTAEVERLNKENRRLVCAYGWEKFEKDGTHSGPCDSYGICSACSHEYATCNEDLIKEGELANSAREKIATLQARVKVLEGALVRYGSHERADCGDRVAKPSGNCKCGLDSFFSPPPPGEEGRPTFTALGDPTPREEGKP